MKKAQNAHLLPLFGILTLLSVVATPLVGTFGPFQNGQASSAPPALFLPAGYAFGIWAVNYLGLFALGVWLLLKPQRQNPRARAAAPWIFVTSIFNVVWILFAGQDSTVPWTVPTLLVMEVSAWIAYFRLNIGNRNLPVLERRLHIPFQIYLGWLSVATVANSAAALNVLGWNGFGLSSELWAVLMLFIATLLAYWVGNLTGGDNVYRAVFVWAFVGITVEQLAFPVVAWTAGILAVVIAGMIFGSSAGGLRRVPHSA